MRLRKMVLAAAGALSVAAGSMWVREGRAQEPVDGGGWNCYTTRFGTECGCPDCWLNNCTC
jgi:hypothetical protein